MATASFSLRSQFVLNFTVTEDTAARTNTQQTWDYTAYMTATGNTTRPYSNNAASYTLSIVTPASTKASGNWGYDYRSPASLTHTEQIASGSFTTTRPASATTYTARFNAADGAGGLIGSATANVTLSILAAVTATTTTTTTTAAPTAPAIPTNFAASTTRTDGINLTWTAVSGATGYDIWWGSTPQDTSTPDFPNVQGTSYLDTGAPDGSRSYYIRSKKSTLNSSWSTPVSGTRLATTTTTTTTTTTAAPTYTVAYNVNGGTGSQSDGNSYLVGATVTVAGQGTANLSGYTFSGWNTNSAGTGTNYQPGETFSMPTGGRTLYAKWVSASVLPSWSGGSADTTFSSIAHLGVPFSAANGYDVQVVANNATSYSLSSGAPSWMSISSSGVLSGTPRTQGASTFTITATSATSNTATTSNLTITVKPPGFRFDSSANKVALSQIKRLDSSGTWVPITMMKRFTGGSWQDISNR